MGQKKKSMVVPTIIIHDSIKKLADQPLLALASLAELWSCFYVRTELTSQKELSVFWFANCKTNLFCSPQLLLSPVTNTNG